MTQHAQKRALIVGIDSYRSFAGLHGAVADAQAIGDLLQRNDDGSRNYDCNLLTSPGLQSITRPALRKRWIELLGNFNGDALFYFAGHGTPTDIGGALVTEDGERDDPGLFMSELLTLANNSAARSVLLILDCCYAGFLGNVPGNRWAPSFTNQAQLREGLTILAASRQTERAGEKGGHGVFTKMVLGGLKGGAADIRGRVSAASIYSYVEQTLGSWEQRPMYKSNADRLDPIRLCTPAVKDSLLRELPRLFQAAESTYRLDPTYERSKRSLAKPENVLIFDSFKIFRNAGLLTTEEGKDLYHVALESKTVRLTPLGQFYWELAKRGVL